MRPWRAAILLGGALTMAVPALAHGFLVSVRGEGTVISGRVYYSDGAPGAGEFVELRDLTDGAQPARSGTTDTAGTFRFDGVAGHRYALIAHGEEGHTTEMEITLRAGERGRLVDAPAPAGLPWPPPAWAVIGAVLLLSTIPALWLRRRGRGEASR